MNYVENLVSTSNTVVPTGYASWLDFWEKRTGCKAPTGFIGVKVKKADNNERIVYIAVISQEQSTRKCPYWHEGKLVPMD